MLYQVIEGNKNIFNAGSKATADISKIANEMDYCPLYVHPIKSTKNIFEKIINQVKYYFEWKSIYKTIKEDSVLLLQHPFRNTQFGREKVIRKLKKEKNLKIISLVHDVELLRGAIYNKQYAKEFEFMKNIADVLIVHNESMKEWFVKNGFPENKLVVLEIFDYLTDCEVNNMDYSKSLIIAGNLDENKSGYISEIENVQDITFNLFGVNYQRPEVPNINYHGAFLPEVLPGQFHEGFGLVWDGSTIKTCDGNTGNYLRYNNPHKLSLYIASGVPVVIWSEAAEAEFVKKNHLGICIDNINNLSEKLEGFGNEKYEECLSNVHEQMTKLRTGYYTKRALTQALDLI